MTNSRNSNNNSNDEEGTGKKPGEGRAQILEQVRTPLVFFALALLIIEASLATIISVGKLPTSETWRSVVIMASLFFVVVTIVAILTYKVPANLLAKLEGAAREEARKVSEGVNKALVVSHYLTNLKKAQKALNVFDKGAPIRGLQQNKWQANLQQDPFLTYVEPTIDEILETPQIETYIDKKTLARLETLSNAQYSVGEGLAELDKIIQELR